MNALRSRGWDAGGVTPPPASGGAATFSSITDTGLTAGRVVYTGVGGLLSASADFTYSGGTTIAISNNVTSGLQFYNTADQTTNYERLQINFAANLALIRSQVGGSGTSRTIQLSVDNSGGSSTMSQQITASQMIFNRGSNNSTATAFSFTSGNQTQSTGTFPFFSILPTYNQTSTAAATDLSIARTETAVGSGPQNFITCAAGAAGTTQIFSFGTTGIFTKPGGAIPLITTSSAITSGGAAQVGTLTNAPTAGNPTKWCPINDNGTTRYVPAW